jgi:hypothetical protein
LGRGAPWDVLAVHWVIPKSSPLPGSHVSRVDAFCGNKYPKVLS